MSEPVALLPCPFCGSPAKFEYEHFRFFVSCHHCGFDQGERDNKKAAIDAWNRRTHPPSERVRELVDSLAKLADSWAFHSDPNVAKCRRELIARLSALAAEGLKEAERG